ncbi:MAG: carbamoyltransferase [Cyclobacteriaceae bacterium]
MRKCEAILGISAYYHDSAAALLLNGNIIAAAQEERFTRVRHDASFPINAIRYVLAEAGLNLDDLDSIVFYEKPFLKFERLLETYHAFAPFGLVSFVQAMPVWIKDKLFMKRNILQELKALGYNKTPLLFTEHHLSHAASAYYPSPFEDAAVLTIDGVGEWATATISHASQNKITLLKEQIFPHSVGLLYSSFTYYAGFRVNSGEYKLMGLAPYADPDSEEVHKLVARIKAEMVDIRDDGSILLNMHYFRFATGLSMTHDAKWEQLLGFTRRIPESNISQEIINLALAAQLVIEEIVLKLARTAQEITSSDNLCLAGGVALNCVANGKIQKTLNFKNIWVKPAAGDAGGALGAALAGWHIAKDKPKITNHESDSMYGALLGPEYSDKKIHKIIKRHTDKYSYQEDFHVLFQNVSKLIISGKIVGWFQGRMEFGPRALGSRSILADPANPEVQKKLNLKIKNRESFRPFAPCVLEEDASLYFDIIGKSPYMLFTYSVKEGLRMPEPVGYKSFPMMEKLYHQRSHFPAITHIDYSARVQTVSRETCPVLHQLLVAFKKESGYGMLVNTSFNVRGEPIVATPEDALRCFFNTEMDVLVMGNYLISKGE